MSQLHELAQQIRGATISQLESAPQDSLLWAPAGTSNHIIWHAGHVLWVQDHLCLERLTGSSELPPGWPDKFGMNCRPVGKTRDWPDRAEFLHLLQTQLDRMLALFTEHVGRLAPSASTPTAAGNLPAVSSTPCTTKPAIRARCIC